MVKTEAVYYFSEYISGRGHAAARAWKHFAPTVRSRDELVAAVSGAQRGARAGVRALAAGGRRGVAAATRPDVRANRRPVLNV